MVLVGDNNQFCGTEQNPIDNNETRIRTVNVEKTALQKKQHI